MLVLLKTTWIILKKVFSNAFWRGIIDFSLKKSMTKNFIMYNDGKINSRRGKHN